MITSLGVGNYPLFRTKSRWYNGLMMSLIKVLARIVAVFTAGALSIIGAASLFDVATLTALLIAGVGAVAVVVEKLARSYVRDGKLDASDIEAAFRSNGRAVERHEEERVVACKKCKCKCK